MNHYGYIKASPPARGSMARTGIEPEPLSGYAFCDFLLTSLLFWYNIADIDE